MAEERGIKFDRFAEGFRERLRAITSPEEFSKISKAYWEELSAAYDPPAAAQLADYESCIAFYAVDTKCQSVEGVLTNEVAFELASSIGRELSRVGYKPKAKE